MKTDKDLIFIFDEGNEMEFIKSVNPSKNSIIVYNNYSTKQKLSGLNFECKSISQYSKQEIGIHKKSIEWIKDWPDKIILNNKNFKELFVYEGITIFWFLETRLYLYRIDELISLIEKIKTIILQEKPTRICIKGPKDVEHIVKEISPGIIDNVKLTEKKKSDASYRSYQGHPTLKMSFLKLIRGMSLRNQTFPNNVKEKVLIITETSSWRKDFDFSLKKNVMRDVFFQDIIKKLKEKDIGVKVIDIENQTTRLLKSQSLIKTRTKSLGVQFESWEKYLTFNKLKNNKKTYQKFLKIWDEIKKSESFRKSLEYDGISLYELIYQDIDDVLKSFKAFAALTLIDAAKRIIDKENPSIIVMYDEYGALQLSLINEAKKRNIPTVSLQHGLITDNILSYYHKPEHITNKNSSLNFPLPDKMCVWSERAKTNLVQFGMFHPSIPVITGDPKVDFLPKAIKTFELEKISKKFNVQKNNKIILFATENLPNQKERVMVAKNVISLMKSLMNFHLILKIHPNETDISIYKKLISEYGLSNYTIIKDANLYELLYLADIVIVSYSTVGVEAMRMGKPVISLNLMDLHNDAPIIREKVAIEVREPVDLLTTTKKYLEPHYSQKLIENGKIFAEKQLGILDGKATYRIINQILQLKNQNLTS